MANSRRDFIKQTALAGMSLSGGGLLPHDFNIFDKSTESMFSETTTADNNLSMIGLYGPWAAKRLDNQLPALSFLRKEWTNLETWREAAKKRVIERLAIPQIGGTPEV